MKKETITKVQPSITSVDFCIHTHENKDGLERVLNSIANDDRYCGASIYIADSSKKLDRGYYKELRKELGEAGLLNRLTIHQVAYRANMAVVRNFFLTVTNSKYKLFINDTNVFTKETDVFKMMTIMEGNEAVGIVGGTIKNGDKKDTPDEDGSPMDQDGVTFSKTSQTNDFILLRNDVKHTLRYDVNSENPHSTFCNAMKRSSYEMVVVDVTIEVKLKDKESDNGNSTNQSAQATQSESSGNSNGSTTKHDVPPGDAGNGRGKNSVSSGKDEKVKNTTTGRG